MGYQSILPMHKHFLQKSIRNINLQRRSFYDQPVEYIETLHMVALAVNSYGLTRVKSADSIPAHCAGIVLGVTASTPEAIFGVISLTSFAYINDYNKSKNKK